MDPQVNPYSAPAMASPPGVLPGAYPQSYYAPLGWRTVLAAASVLGVTLVDTAMRAAQAMLGSTEDLAAKHDLVGLAIVGLTGFGVVVLSICSWVFVPVWMHRASANLRGLGRYGMEFTPGSCAGWFFVPIANLVKPPQAMSEIWRASDPNEGEGAWVKSSSTPLIALWWATWLISGVMSPLEIFAKGPAVGFAGCAFRGVAAVCLVALLQGVASRQAQAAGRLTGAA
jgi:hypothetical protein